MQHAIQQKRGGPFWAVALVAVTIVGLVLALSTYSVGRSRSEASHPFGNTATKDRVDLSIWVGKLDPASQTATVEVLAQPKGALADKSGFFAKDALIYTSALKADPIKIKAGEPVSAAEVKVVIEGTITDYPFDSYAAILAFDVYSGDQRLPVAAAITSGDTLFQLEESPAPGVDAGIDVTLHANRSLPTLVFALFIMTLMLGLALAAATACFYVLKGRRGLMFPACSMMGALLFALVPLRNAVPGSPPIGSVIDFASFFLAEGIISAALVGSVVIGYRVEMAKEEEEQRKKQQAELERQQQAAVHHQQQYGDPYRMPTHR